MSLWINGFGDLNVPTVLLRVPASQVSACRTIADAVNTRPSLDDACNSLIREYRPELIGGKIVSVGPDGEGGWFILYAHEHAGQVETPERIVHEFAMLKPPA